MLRWRSLLLAGLLAAGPARAEREPVDVRPLDREGRFSVSWELPPGFDESELLVEIEAGPRVRLSGEIRSRSPRVDVVLPRLAGRARFVVRAGRDEDEPGPRGLAERDVAFSESFSLAAIPASQARTPVRAAASRPAPGHEMEWWSEPPAAGLEGPGAGLSASRVAGRALDPDRLHIKKRRRPASPFSTATPSRPRSRHPLRLTLPSRPPGSRPFSGAAVPLRN